MSHHGYKYTTLGELKLFGRTVRNSMCLPEAERALLLFILDRTTGWHRIEETISPAQFANGVRRRGRIISQGTCLAAETIAVGLQRLEQMQAVFVERDETQTSYRLNEDWSHPDLEGSQMWKINESDFTYLQDRTE